jgi:hypothetical protein
LLTLLYKFGLKSAWRTLQADGFSLFSVSIFCSLGVIPAEDVSEKK